MKHRLLRILIIFLLITAAADIFGTSFILLKYPKIELYESDLYSVDDNSRLKDYALGEDGLLTVLSDDPWISYDFSNSVNIYSVRINLSSLGGPGIKRAQIYLFPLLSFKDFELQEEMNVRFGFGQQGRNVDTIRLDLGSVEGITLAVDHVLINSRKDVFFACQSVAARGFLLLLFFSLFIAELYGWLRLKGSHKKSLIAVMLILWLMKAIVLYALRNELIDAAGDRSTFISAWLFVAGIECFSVIAVFHASGRLKGDFLFGYLIGVPLSFLIFGLSELLSLLGFYYESNTYLFLNLALCFLIFAVLHTVIRRPGPSVSLTLVVFTSLAIANHYYGSIRGTPLEYFDLFSAETALKVIGNYSFNVDHLVAAALIGVAAVIAESFFFLGLHGPKISRISFVFSALLTAAGCCLFYTAVPTEYIATPIITSAGEGYYLSFMSLMKMGKIDKPDGYTVERAEEILLKAGGSDLNNTEPLDLPDIFVIMDESFADLPAIYGFETNEDVLPGLHSLSGNTVSGSVLTSVYGGGTVMTEYEFLTGNSLYFFPEGSSPFVQYLNKNSQSLASRLKNLGYQTTAYHPYAPGNYRRSEGYPLLGFEKFLSIEDELPFTETIRSYLSDRADFSNIKYIYENRDKTRPFFIFNVTMQNHGGYASAVSKDNVFYPLSEELRDDELMGYLSLIHETDSALTEFINYLSDIDRDAILLFFGDHQPTQTADFKSYADLYGNADGTYVPEMLMNYTSFIIWANFDITGKNEVISSPNYLRSLLLDSAGIELNAYESFLSETSEEIPSINSSGRVDTAGLWHSRSGEETGLIKDYGYLVYANAFDQSNISAEYFE